MLTLKESAKEAQLRAERNIRLWKAAEELAKKLEYDDLCAGKENSFNYYSKALKIVWNEWGKYGQFESTTRSGQPYKKRKFNTMN